MNFTDIFIKRPVFASVISLIILLLGIICYTKLTVRQYPRVDDTAITITTNYSGASPQLMEGFITGPIENALAGIDGIDYITSSSTQGQSLITVHFNLGYDINTAAADVSSKVQSARSDLPQDIYDPIVEKRDPNSQPSLFIGVTSKKLDREAITDYLNRVIQPQIATLPGVGQAQIWGKPYAMRIWLDPEAMAAHNVTMSDINSALINNNQQTPAGSIENNDNILDVNLESDLSTATEFNNLVIKNNNNQPVKIKDVGRAELGAQSNSTSVKIDGKNAVIMAITPSPTANPLEISQEIKTAFAHLASQMPQDLKMQINWDASQFISASINEVKKSVIESGVIVLLVMLLFLGSLRILTIPAVTIPLSLVGVCSLMLMFGFSINTLTLLAMVLAIGMVVDDAIVVSENIHRHMELGKTPQLAAIDGAREIQFAIIAMTFTLAAVFAPIGFLTDITGALFKEFAFTLAGAVIISGFIALTLTPMMCSKLMTSHSHQEKIFDRWLKKIIIYYQQILKFVLSHLKWVGLVLIAIIATVIFLYSNLPRELAPSEDTGAIFTQISGPPAANLPYMEKYTQALQPIYDAIPEKVTSLIITGSNDQSNMGMSFLILKPWDERTRSVPQIIASIAPKMWAIPGIQAFPVNPFRLPGSNDFTPIKFYLKTTGSYEELAATMNKLINAANQNPGLTNLSTDLKFDNPELQVNINRNKAADLGVSMNDIGSTLNLALGEPLSGHFEMSGRSYEVIPQLESSFMNTPDAINNLDVRSASGQLVPLSNLVSMQTTTLPEDLPHFQQQRVATLTGSLNPGYSLGQALDYLQTTAKQIMPSNIQYDFGGTSRQFIQANSSMEQTFIFALLFILLILAAQFESFIDPLIVMFSVIPAIAGALIALKFTGGTLNIYTEIGLVTLIGLISKHGILMVEFANQLREEGKSIHEAIIESAGIRFRPILMTTLAMVLGALPLVFAHGAGALSRQQIGWVITGGMLFGTCITLFIVPCAYIITKQLKHLSLKKPVTINDEESPETN